MPANVKPIHKHKKCVANRKQNDAKWYKQCRKQSPMRTRKQVEVKEKKRCNVAIKDLVAKVMRTRRQREKKKRIKKRND
jgi:hypothetical protein